MSKVKKHKRKGPKSTRAGCMMCKPHKHQNNDKRTLQDIRADQAFKAESGDV